MHYFKCLGLIQKSLKINSYQFDEIKNFLSTLKYEGESNINGNFAVDCTKHVRT